MKPSFAPRLALCLLLTALLAAGGCAYTTVTAKERPHAPLPAVKAGLRALMPPVMDKRAWQMSGPEAPIPDVRLFAPEIDAQLRQELLDSGLFAALPVPGDPRAKNVTAKLQMDVTAFSLNKLGTNAWVVPHLLLDGAVLPVFTGAAIYSQGRVDLGSYLLPSNRMGTTITVKLTYSEGSLDLLEKTYSTQVEMEQVSERKYLETINDASTHGVEMSRQEGRKAIKRLSQAIVGDPSWKSLPQLRRLETVEAMFDAGKPLDQLAAAVEDLLPLLDTRLTYLEEETKVLRDGYLDAEARAGIISDLRARWLGLADAKALPAEQVVNEARAEQLFDDPDLPRHQVESMIAERVMLLALKVMNPVAPSTARPAARATTQVVPPTGFRTPAAGVAPELAPGATGSLALAAQTGRTGAPGASNTPERRGASAAPETSAASPALAPLPTPLPPARIKALRQQMSQELSKRVRGDLRLQVLLVQQAEKAVGADWAPMAELLKQVGAAYTDKYLNTRKG